MDTKENDIDLRDEEWRVSDKYMEVAINFPAFDGNSFSSSFLWVNPTACGENWWS